MAHLTKKEFAAKTGQTTKTLSTYILRHKVTVEDNGLIDTTLEINKAFMGVHSAKADLKSSVAPPIVIPVENVLSSVKASRRKEITQVADDGDEEENQEDENGIPALFISEKRLKHAQAKKTEAAEELDRLRIEKLKGDVVPTEPIEILIFQFKQYLLTQQKIGYESFLNEITQKYSISSADMAFYRSFFIKAINNSMADASELFVKDLEGTLAAFSIKKGR